MSGQYILGREVALFEKEFAEYLGVKYAVGVGNGTDALNLALRACGIGPGDEVITVSHTQVATVAAIEITGAKPVLVDIEPDYFTLDPQKIVAAITPKTRAIIPVHLYGQAADLEPILKVAKKYHLYVIEDGAQAHGAMYHNRRVGTWGHFGCFSFYPTKNLGALGDGGAVVTDNFRLAQKVRKLRQYGWTEKRLSLYPGINSRLDEIQAAILRVKLKSLDQENKRRRFLAEIYHKNLIDRNLVLPAVRSNSTHVYHQYVIRTKNRDRMRTYLSNSGIQTMIHYSIPVHLHPVYKNRLKPKTKLVYTEQAVGEILSLPIYPELTPKQINSVIRAIHKFNN